MKHSVCLFTVSGTGHNLYYFKILIPALLEKNYNVTLALPIECVNSDAYKTNVAPFLNDVEVVTHTGKLFASALKNSWAECQRLKQSINAMPEAPSMLLAPNGSSIPYIWPIFRTLNKTLFSSLKTIAFGMLSVGIDCSGSTVKTRLLNLLRTLLLSLNSRGSLKTIDAYGYQVLTSSRSSLRSVFSLVPDPMDNTEVINKQAARALFNLPQHAFVVSISGALNSHPRKNTKLLIDSISSASIQADIVLLAAGKMSAEIKQQIHALSAEQQRRFKVVDRYLSDEEINAVTAASDVVCTPYSGHYAPSGVVLRAIKCNVPVIVPDYHWFKYIIDTFHVGWTIKALDVVNLTSTINQAVREIQSGEYTTPTNNAWLKAYFSEENFVNHWLAVIDQTPANTLSFAQLLEKYHA